MDEDAKVFMGRHDVISLKEANIVTLDTPVLIDKIKEKNIGIGDIMETDVSINVDKAEEEDNIEKDRRAKSVIKANENI